MEPRLSLQAIFVLVVLWGLFVFGNVDMPVPPTPKTPTAPPIHKMRKPPDKIMLSSWYGIPFHGRTTANGEKYDRWGLTVAHKTLRFNTELVLRHPRTKKTVRVRVNDRGPYIGKRELDVSERVAEILEFKDSGLARLEVWVVNPCLELP